jgi:hypothetical protein
MQLLLKPGLAFLLAHPSLSELEETVRGPIGDPSFDADPCSSPALQYNHLAWGRCTGYGRLMSRVERIDVRAGLDDPVPALARATLEAAAGDQSWADRATQFELGEALIVRVDVSVLAVGSGRDEIETTIRGVFVENDAHPPKLEQQIAEVARTKLPLVAERLRDLGHSVGVVELDEMYVHVELERQLRDALRTGRAAG